MALEESCIPIWAEVNPVSDDLLDGRMPISKKSRVNYMDISIMDEEVQQEWSSGAAEKPQRRHKAIVVPRTAI